MKIRNLFKRYHTTINLVRDIILGVFAFVVAYWIDRGTVNLHPKLRVMWIYFIPCIIMTITTMALLKGYRVEWRYAGITEVVNVLIAFAISGIIAIILKISIRSFKSIQLSTVFLFYFFHFCFALFWKLSTRLVLVLKKRFRIVGSNNENMIVYGSGYTGATLVKRLLDKPEEGYDPVAIIDDDPAKHHKFVSDVPVIGGRDCIGYAIRKYKATTIAIAISKINKKDLLSIYSYIKNFKIKIKVTSNMSGADAVLNSEVISLKNLKIEDLLHRKEHKLDKDLLDSFITGNIIMVTGGAGSIGSEICRQALQYRCKHLIIFDHHEYGMFKMNEEFKKSYTSDMYSLEVGSVRDKEKVRRIIEKYRPDIVFHAAAYKHVPMMEISADEAVKNNIIGTENVIEQSQINGVKKFILISTDKAINPANVMGASKRVAELILQCRSQNQLSDNKMQLAAVRFGNVLGSSGSVIPIFMEQINERQPITVTHPEMQRYFMTIPEAVRLVIQAGALAQGGEVFVLDMGDPVYIKDLAIDLIRASGLIPEKDIRIEYSGLRPGEKLFEELSYNNENVDKTKHSGIFVCRLENVDCSRFLAQLAQLKIFAKQNDKEKVEDILFNMVPSEYRKANKKGVAQ